MLRQKLKIQLQKNLTCHLMRFSFIVTRAATFLLHVDRHQRRREEQMDFAAEQSASGGGGGRDGLQKRAPCSLADSAGKGDGYCPG